VASNRIAVVAALLERTNSECVAKMPNSAFSPECRVPENAERCRLGLDLASLAYRALGIISGVLQGV
jgi:hypothetical protein